MTAFVVSVEAVLAWCDHIDSRAPATPGGLGRAQRIYYDGMREGVKECIAQVRQAAVHGFDVAALDGRPLT